MKRAALSITNQADRKRSLIASALAQLHDAKQIDEREDHVDDWIRWYDETIGDCNQIEIVAGAMRVELALRRGIVADSGNEREAVPHVLTPAERTQRKTDGALASAPSVVKDYLTETVANGRVPSIRGALRIVKRERISGVTLTPLATPASDAPAPDAQIISTPVAFAKFYRHLRTQIIRRRKYATVFRKSREYHWNQEEGASELIFALEKLLDWIERELDRIPSDANGKRAKR